MGRKPCCSKVGVHRGAWSSDEDKLLTNYIQTHGEGKWRELPTKAGLFRCGKSCRLRWMNYLRPGVKRGNFTSDENDAIIRLHSVHGNRWSLIATKLPGRTDNEIKNHWSSNLRKMCDGSLHPKISIKKKTKFKDQVDPKKSKKVKISDSATLSSSSSSSLSESLSKNESFDNGIVSGASSSCTVDLGDVDFDFPWSNWTPILTVEDGPQNDDFVVNDLDLLMMLEDDESLRLERLYNELLNLVNYEDEDGHGNN